MIFIDGDEQPTINGTGTEDYFGHAYGMQHIPDGLYHGVSVFAPDDPQERSVARQDDLLSLAHPRPDRLPKVHQGDDRAWSCQCPQRRLEQRRLLVSDPTDASLPPLPEPRLRLPVEP